MKFKLWFVLPSVTILICLGAVNISKFNQTRLLHQQKILEAQMLIADTNNDKANLSISSLKLSYTKMKETISILESVPNILGYSYAQAQDNLLKIRPAFNQIENRLQIEEQAKINLESAQKLNVEVAKITEQTYSDEIWQQARDKEQQAIALLKTVPPRTFLETQIKNELAASQVAYEEIINTIKKETVALKYIQSAEEVALEAASKSKSAMTNYSDDSINNLLKLKSQWELTLKLLNNVSSATASFEESQHLRTYYELNLQSTNNALEQLKKCVKQNYGGEFSCNDEVALSIVMSPIGVKANKQELSTESSQGSYSGDKSGATAIETSQSPTETEQEAFKQEFKDAFCKEVIKKYPSHPYYLDCKERGY